MSVSDDNPAYVSGRAADQLRQAERTVDNLKRLYAVLFAVSFTVLANVTFQKIANFARTLTINWEDVFLQGELTTAFVITAGLFYYQGDRFLDVSYARAPIADIKPAHFGIDYLVNVFTMAPFFLMANALSGRFIADVGFTWFFIAYLTLISFGLFLLLVRDVLSLFVGTVDGLPAVQAIKVFWMLMNGVLLLAVLLLFGAFQHAGYACPPKMPGLGFVAVLGGIIFLRDYLDFTRGWAIFYPVREGATGASLRWPLPMLLKPRHRVWTRLIAYAVLALVGLAIWWTRVWDVVSLATICRAA